MTTDTKIDIDSMTADRELDALVAEKVMGFTVRDTSSDETPWRQCYGCLYRDDLDDIIEIESINDDGPVSNYSICLKQYSTDISAAWQVALKAGIKNVPVSDDAPLWICRAALKIKSI